jgi:hypothetical protein
MHLRAAADDESPATAARTGTEPPGRVIMRKIRCGG